MLWITPKGRKDTLYSSIYILFCSFSSFFFLLISFCWTEKIYMLMFILNCKPFKRISNDHFHIELLDSQLTDTEPISTISYWREINYRAVLQADEIHQVVWVRAVWSLHMSQEILQITFPVSSWVVSLTGLHSPSPPPIVFICTQVIMTLRL